MVMSIEVFPNELDKQLEKEIVTEKRIIDVFKMMWEGHEEIEEKDNGLLKGLVINLEKEDTDARYKLRSLL